MRGGAAGEKGVRTRWRERDNQVRMTGSGMTGEFIKHAGRVNLTMKVGKSWQLCNYVATLTCSNEMQLDKLLQTLTNFSAWAISGRRFGHEGRVFPGSKWVFGAPQIYFWSDKKTCLSTRILLIKAERGFGCSLLETYYWEHIRWHAREEQFFFFFSIADFFLPWGTITPDATIKNAAAPKTPWQKCAGQNSAVRLWSGPACATNHWFWVQYIFF